MYSPDDAVLLTTEEIASGNDSTQQDKVEDKHQHLPLLARIMLFVTHLQQITVHAQVFKYQIYHSNANNNMQHRVRDEREATKRLATTNLHLDRRTQHQDADNQQAPITQL